jgi:uncharacterized protein
MNIVLDTNVLVSGLINPDGNPAKILNMVLNGEIILLYDIMILDEYRQVLRRDKFGFPEDIVEPFLDFIAGEGISVTPNPTSIKFKDEDDKKFYEVAISGNADYLITGNKIHFPREKTIISPTEFLLINFL